MQLVESISIAAPPDRVWAVLMDVEGWPQWTQSMTRLERLQPGDLAVGSRVRITQPKLPHVVWTVTALEPGRYFAWRGSSPGVRTDAGHRIETEGNGSRVTLTIEQSGLLSPLVGLMYGRLTKRYVDMEARGLKARCEAGV